MNQETLSLTCDCIESGGACGTWLELTPDGFLTLEDKDGLQITIMLPDWLAVVMRTAMQEHAATKKQARRAVRGRLEEDVPF